MATGTPSYNPPLTGDLSVEKGGVPVAARPEINFIEGANVTLTVADDAANNQVDVTIAASGSGVTLAASTLAGRGSASGSGVAEEITLGTNLTMSGTTLNASAASGAATTEPFVTIGNTAGLTAERALTGSGRVSVTDGGAGTTVTLDIPNNGVGNAQLRQGAARSVIGVTGNATANVADIAGGGAGTYLRDSGTALAFSGVKEIIENLALAGDLSPAQIIADQNDYNPTNLAMAGLLRISTDASRTITGLAGGADGRVLGVLNVGAFDAVLSNQNALSTVGNRFLFGADCTLAAEHGCLIWYDSTSSRWRLLARAFPFTAAPATRSLTAGAGLTGGGDLSADRTFTIVAGDSSITVNADDIIVAALGISTAKLAANAVTDAKFRQSAALSLVGRSANSAGDVADISATAATDAVLRESGSAIGFGTIASGGIANNAVTDTKLRDSGALSVIGRSANSGGDPADISAVAASGAVLRESGSTIGFGTVAADGLATDSVITAKILDANVTAAKLASNAVETAKILDANVTFAKIENGSARSLLGRAANSAGVHASIAGGGAGTYAHDNGTTVAFRRILPREVALTDGANIAVDASLVGQGDAFTVTLGGNRTMDAPTNPTAGQWLVFIIRQDATGSRTVTWSSAAGGYRFTTTVTSPTLTTGANKFDSVLFRYNATDNKWDAHAVNLSA